MKLRIIIEEVECQHGYTISHLGFRNDGKEWLDCPGPERIELGETSMPREAIDKWKEAKAAWPEQPEYAVDPDRNHDTTPSKTEPGTPAPPQHRE